MEMLKQKTRLQHAENLKGKILHDICTFSRRRIFLLVSPSSYAVV
jgi:hypothetical protein